MKKIINSALWDQALIEKYNYTGPRYTSYPTALEFHSNFTNDEFIKASFLYPDKPLSLYVHIPFCHQICYFCGCNKIITRNYYKVATYFEALIKEIESRAPFFKNRVVTQMHWGGGTPTFLNNQEITTLITVLKKNFNFSAEAELSIEIDPRDIETSKITHLKNEGFNRISIGIQDFDPHIQSLINRIQDESLISSLVAQARTDNFNSISFDLIYGLPKQNSINFMNTLKKVVALSPDRISLFNYAHLPTRIAAQQKIKEADLPKATEKLNIFRQSVEFLINHGYIFIGMDHFAKPTDELALAQKNHQLHRNFQGYTTQKDIDLLGLGVSAISIIGNSYSQNEKDLKSYQDLLHQQSHAVCKGLTMTVDDIIRRDVIIALICHFRLDKKEIEARYNIDFDDYFKEDLKLINTFIQDELVKVSKNYIEVMSKGYFLIRNICMCFDIYMRRAVNQHLFSRII